METGYVLLIVFMTLMVGVMFGRFVLKAKINPNRTQGVLYVDTNAPEGRGLFLEQTVLTSEIADRDHVVFKVIVLRDSRK